MAGALTSSLVISLGLSHVIWCISNCASVPAGPFPSTTTLVVQVPLLPSIIKIHLSTPDFLNATPMALLESFKQTTPPASIVDGPLTPPSTADAKFSARVAAILRAFKSCQNGYPPSVPWTVYKLNSEEYEDLQPQQSRTGKEIPRTFRRPQCAPG